MRLTLRTLLAYMDGLLDAKDSQEIGKKIEDSESATELFHKIRDVMRRLRLGAPSITERGANLDCNTVAEYLDNALPSDRVPEFEMVSLKSDMHLAEVASCHQILTMVLGEPVEIDPESRQRMYQLPAVANRVDEERLAAAEAATVLSGDGSAASPPSSPIKVRPRPVVPEYLRESEEVAASSRRGHHAACRRRDRLAAAHVRPIGPRQTAGRRPAPGAGDGARQSGRRPSARRRRRKEVRRAIGQSTCPDVGRSGCWIPCGGAQVQQNGPCGPGEPVQCARRLPKARATFWPPPERVSCRFRLRKIQPRNRIPGNLLLPKGHRLRFRGKAQG